MADSQGQDFIDKYGDTPQGKIVIYTVGFCGILIDILKGVSDAKVERRKEKRGN